MSKITRIPIHFRHVGILCAITTISVSALKIPITLKEFHGVARNGEPVVTGIPLPKGVYTDPSKFRIQGTTLFQTTPLVHWPDGSIRWLQTQFMGTVGAGQEIRYFLTDDNAAAPVAGTLSVTENATHVIVNTGNLQFKVKKTGGFNLFDEVILDGFTLVSPSSENGVRITAASQSLLFKSAGEDSAYTVTILEKGPVRTCIRVDGYHGNVVAKDHGFYDYSCFIYAYAGKSYVLVSYVLANAPYWTPRGPLKFTDLSLRTKVNLDAAKTLTLFGAAQSSGVMGAKGEITQVSATAYTSSQGNGTKALGWLDVSDANRGVAVGIKQFWEYFPKALSTDLAGNVDVSLFPALSGNVYYLQDLAKKEHQAMFYFHTGSATAADVQGVMGGMLNHRLVPTAPVKWYSDTRAVLGDLADTRSAITHPSLPLVNAHIGDATHWTEGWYNFGYDVYLNDDNARELFHDESTVFFHSLNPLDYLKWEASTRVEGLKPYHLHRDFKTLELFFSRSDPKVNPGNMGHANYFRSPAGPRLETLPSDAVHWGAGTLATQKGWTSFPEGWLVQNIEHMDVKHILDWYCFTGDYFAKDIIREAGEYRGAFTIIYYNSWVKPGDEPNVNRVVAASGYNMAAYYMVYPTPANLAAITNSLGQYWLRAPGLDGFFQTLEGTDPISGFQEGMAAHTGGLLYEVSGAEVFKTALEKTGPTWLNKVVKTNGYIPYRHTGPNTDTTGLPSVATTQQSMYRNIDGGMTLVQHLTAYNEIFTRLKLTEAAMGKQSFWGRDQPYMQKFYLAIDNPGQLSLNPMPNVIAAMKDSTSYMSGIGPRPKVSRRLVLEGPTTRAPGNTYFTYSVDAGSSGVNVELTIFTLSGKSVRTLVQGRKAKGTYFAFWDCKDSLNSLVSHGTYYALLKFNQSVTDRAVFTLNP